MTVAAKLGSHLSFAVACMLGCSTVHKSEDMSTPYEVGSGSLGGGGAPGFITASVLNVRECPSTNCRIIAKQYEGDKVQIIEAANGWGKLIKHDSGNQTGWISLDYVDINLAAIPAASSDVSSKSIKRAQKMLVEESKCSEKDFERANAWKRAKSKSDEQTYYVDCAGDGIDILRVFLNTKNENIQFKKLDGPMKRIVAKSDDYRSYKQSFALAAKKLIEAKKCTYQDFNQMGGWVRSSNHKPNPIYFTYCGEMTRSNRVYLNASTGKISFVTYP